MARKEELERTNHFLFPFYGSSRFLFSSAAESLLRREIQTEWEREGGGRGTSPFFRLSELVGGWWRKKKQRAGSVSSTPVWRTVLTSRSSGADRRFYHPHTQNNNRKIRIFNVIIIIEQRNSKFVQLLNVRAIFQKTFHIWIVSRIKCVRVLFVCFFAPIPNLKIFTNIYNN